MIIIIICLVSSIIITIVAIVLAKIGYDNDKYVIPAISGSMAIVGFGIGICFIVMLPFYHGASVKAKIINKTYDTNYTTDEVFWSGDMINKLIRTENDVKDNNIKLEIE